MSHLRPRKYPRKSDEDRGLHHGLAHPPRGNKLVLVLGVDLTHPLPQFLNLIAFIEREERDGLE